jgi:hypothetical protein
MNRGERRRAAAEEKRRRKQQEKADRQRRRLRLVRFVIDRAAFDRIPEDERIFFILAGRMANELNSLTRLSFWCYNGAEPVTGGSESPADLTAFARFSQAFLLLKISISQLWEAWGALRTSFLAKRFSREYVSKLPKEAAQGLEILKRIFGRSKGFRLVRNKFSFHYEADLVKEYLSALPQGETLDWFLSPKYSDSFSALAERLHNFALLRSLGESDDPGKAISGLLDKAADAVAAFNVFLAGFNFVVMEKYLSGSRKEELVVENAPGVLAVEIPFFALDDRR